MACTCSTMELVTGPAVRLHGVVRIRWYTFFSSIRTGLSLDITVVDFSSSFSVVQYR